MAQHHSVSFQSRYKSITALPTVQLPAFVVLTGANGSGKSHALEALKNGHLRSSLSANPASEVALYDWNTIIPQDTGLHIPAQEKINRANLFVPIRSQREQQLRGIQAFADQNGIAPEHVANWDRVRKLLDPQHIQAILGDAGKAEAARAALQNQLANVAQAVRGQVPHNSNDPLHRAVQKLFKEEPMAFLFEDESTFFRHTQFLWGEVDTFQQAFARLFTTYRELQRSELAMVGARQWGMSTEPGLGPAEFQKMYGRPPWEFVNSILELNGLDFRIDHPSLKEDEGYEPRLTKLSKDVEMRFADLSSGERVLMSFGLCLYNSLETRHARKFPKLLLLDEVDAPLHPSMVRFLLKTIEETLVRDSNVAVIMTTHSPTTVGLANEDYVYLMNPSGPSIDKTTKSKALSVLTEGVPTMSISFDGRRQVFVESSRDATIYDKLYQQYKSELAHERSLTFVPVGHTNCDGQDTGAGCDQVLSIVKQLATGGNQTVLGLIDWDGRHPGDGRVHVLCHGVRDGLENLILDPVLVVAALAHHSAKEARKSGLLDDDETFTALSMRTPERWQSSIDRLCALVYGDEASSHQKQFVNYLGGMTLSVDVPWLKMDDHELEKKLLGALPPLNGPKKQHHSLNAYVANVILQEHRHLLPVDLISTFRSLLTAEL